MQYLTEQFAALGLEPGGADGTWVQEVPLVSITADPDMALTITGAGGSKTFDYGSEFVAGTPRVVERRRHSKTRSWSSSATAPSPPSSAGTTTPAWT